MAASLRSSRRLAVPAQETIPLCGTPARDASAFVLGATVSRLRLWRVAAGAGGEGATRNCTSKAESSPCAKTPTWELMRCCMLLRTNLASRSGA
eukprot:3940765-Rhodomonas_salina.2